MDKFFVKYNLVIDRRNMKLVDGEFVLCRNYDNSEDISTTARLGRRVISIHSGIRNLYIDIRFVNNCNDYKEIMMSEESIFLTQIVNYLN